MKKTIIDYLNANFTVGKLRQKIYKRDGTDAGDMFTSPIEGVSEEEWHESCHEWRMNTTNVNVNLM